jgi:YD repeat-containing protein
LKHLNPIEMTRRRAATVRALIAALALAFIACGPSTPEPSPREKQPVAGKELITGPAYDFSYDEAGRLSTVAAPSGDTAQYVYDPTGNILQILRFAPGTLNILGFFPSSGIVGQVVTVRGTGFSTTPSQNTVKLNGLAVTVSYSSSTLLTFNVPAGATTGPISVTVGSSTATTTSVFTVTAPLVSITDFSPKLGRSGTAVTITGTGFDTLPVNNRVYIGRALATVTSPATPTSIQAVVSGNGPSGLLRVSTPFGSASSTAEFYFLPGTYAATDVVATGRTSLGSTAAVNIATAGKASLLIFDATQGQYVTAYVTNVTLPGTTYLYLYGPDSGFVTYTSVTQGSAFKVDFGQLPSTGTYTLAVQAAGGSTGGLSIQLLPAATGTMTINGPALTANLLAAQNGRYTFSGTLGQRLTLGVTPGTPFGGGSINIYSPDGSVLLPGLCPCAINTSDDKKLDLGALPMGGTYTVTLTQNGVAAGTASLQLASEATGTLTVDGSAASIALGTAQNGRYTFSANASAWLGLGVTSLSTTPASRSVDLSIADPSGTIIWTGTASGPWSWQLPQLTSTGTYTLRVMPQGATSASVTLLASNALTGTVTLDAAATHFQTTRAGQSGRYTFTGTSGQGVTMEGTAGGTYWPIYLNIYAPDGSTFTSRSLYAGNDIKLDLAPLPMSGTYLVTLGPVRVDTGTVDLRLISEATGTVAVDGASLSVTLGTAQNGRCTFSANASAWLGAAVTAFATTPSGGSVDLQISGPGGFLWAVTINTSGSSWQLPQTTATGTYTFRVMPQGTNGATLTFLASNALTGTVTLDAAATRYQTTRAGQSGRYTFTGTAGQGVTMQATTGGYWPIYLTIYAPDGSSFTFRSLYAGIDAKLDLAPLPMSGTYLVALAPIHLDTGTVDLRLVSEATGTFVINAAAAPITLGAAQNGRYTFSANANDLVTLAISSFATTPSGGSVDLQILAPNGATIWSTTISGSGSWALPQFTATGTYTLRVMPQGTRAASMSVQFTR